MAGSTGYTGQEIVRALRERGVRTLAHVRPDSSKLAAFQAQFGALGAEVDTTPWEEDALTATFEREKPQVIFATLGTTRVRAKAEGRDAEASYRAIDYGLSAMLIRAAVRSGHRPRYVYLSAMMITDKSTNPYMKARADVERELRASGLPFTIIRPAIISGEDREDSRPGERFAAHAGDAVLGALAFFGAKKLRDRYASLDARTLAEGMVAAALDPAAEGKELEPDALRKAAGEPSKR